MTYHACVWIDHYNARIFNISATTAETNSIEDSGQKHHIHRKADHVGLGTEPVRHAFLDEVAAALGEAKAILITGPGAARTELAEHLRDKFPAVAAHIWGIEPMDHPSDGELIAAARQYFHAADRMHR